MIPFPNVLAGILIGIANDNWFARIIAPFIWGAVFCVYVSIVRRVQRDAFIADAEMHNRELRGGMSPLLAFYFIEYMTASSTALLFSILSGFIKGLF